MLWVVRLSGLCSLAMVIMVLSPSFQSFPPAEAIRSSHFLRLHSAGDYDLHFAVASSDSAGLGFRQAPFFHNAAECEPPSSNGTSVCNPSLVHIAITLDEEYLRDSIAVVHSVLTHARCPESIFFHFLVSEPGLEPVMRSTFPGLRFKTYYFDPERVRGLISTSVRQALEQPLNYAWNYLAEILEQCMSRNLDPSIKTKGTKFFSRKQQEYIQHNLSFAQGVQADKERATELQTRVVFTVAKEEG
ncbi:hypothetical protein Cni_G17626 [Canna indica]|uniref:Hexosyltransferase n=1 Tax=Canna indica TaxID=4628 RepID=A0AAQ3KKV8_9LILI|nr:hypothetical protein Cni_G17626 [Canna indica]